MSEFDFNALKQTLSPNADTKPLPRSKGVDTMSNSRQILQDIQAMRQTLDTLKAQHQGIQDKLELILRHLGYDPLE